MKEKASFIMYKTSLEILSDLTTEQCGELFLAIRDYQNGIEREISPIIKVAFSPIKNQFRRDEIKYENQCLKNAANGALGGRPKKTKPKQHKPKKPTGLIRNPKNPNEPDIDIDIDIDNDNEKILKPLSSSPAKNAADIDRVFTHWKRVMNHPRAKLDQKRTMLIQKALATGYSVDDLMTAITGCSRTPHNMGDNDRGERYDGLHIIFRSADQIDRFIGNAERPVVPVTKNKSAIMESARAAKNIIGISQERLT